MFTFVVTSVSSCSPYLSNKQITVCVVLLEALVSRGAHARHCLQRPAWLEPVCWPRDDFSSFIIYEAWPSRSPLSVSKRALEVSVLERENGDAIITLANAKSNVGPQPSGWVMRGNSTEAAGAYFFNNKVSARVQMNKIWRNISNKSVSAKRFS